MLGATTRVLKLGGSLLTGLDLPALLKAWLCAESPVPTLIVVGGGELANAVRELDLRYGLSAEAAHWQAIRAMRVHAFVLRQLCPESMWVDRLSDWPRQQADAGRQVGLLDPLSFLTRDEPTMAGRPLPCGWHVTSDSIAARLACGLGAVELVLLKSTLPAHSPAAHSSATLTYQEAADAGLVDEYFPIAAEGLPHVRAVNLRAAGWPELRLLAKRNARLAFGEHKPSVSGRSNFS